MVSKLFVMKWLTSLRELFKKTNKRIDAYQHTHNKECIYRRIGDTNIFVWSTFERTEESIRQEIVANDKFIPYKEKNIK